MKRPTVMIKRHNLEIYTVDACGVTDAYGFTLRSRAQLPEMARF